MRSYPIKSESRRAENHRVVRRPNSDYVQILVVGATLAALLALAVLVVNRESSDAVAANAEVAVLAESALSATAAARTVTNLAGILHAGGFDAEVVSDVRETAEEGVAELNDRLDRLSAALEPASRSELAEVAVRFESAVADVLSSLDEEDPTARTAALAELSVSHEGLTDHLAAVRDDHTSEILVAGEGLGQAVNAVRFMIVFLLPLVIIISVWRALRRSASQRVLTEALHHEREVSTAKDSFIADVSHELRTPLTGILGFASALEDERESLPPLAAELVGLIVTEAAELSRMVDDLVAAGRLDAEAITFEIEPVELLGEIQEVLLPFGRRGISVELDDINTWVWADRRRLRQVLRNLLSNAAKHGGQEIAVTAYAKGEFVVVEVIDDGPGVPPEVEARMFDRYVHSNGAALVEGSVGLGLAIARSFAERMGGSLEYERTDGLTIFAVHLPQAAEPVGTEEPELTAVLN